MSYSITCRRCHQQQEIPADRQGGGVYCVHCGEEIILPPPVPHDEPAAWRLPPPMGEKVSAPRPPVAVPVAERVTRDVPPTPPPVPGPAEPDQLADTKPAILDEPLAAVRRPARNPAQPTVPIRANASLSELLDEDADAPAGYVLAGRPLGVVGRWIDRLEWDIRAELSLTPRAPRVSRFVASQKLMLTVAAVAAVAFLQQAGSGYVWRGVLLGVVGGLIYWRGTRPWVSQGVPLRLAAWTYLVLLITVPLATRFVGPQLSALWAKKSWPSMSLDLSRFVGSGPAKPSNNRPSFPPLGPRLVLSMNVDLARVSLPIPTDQPGHAATVLIYVPRGTSAPQSLSCVFIAPSGTNLLSGRRLSTEDQAEYLPLAEARMVVVVYEMDGVLPQADTVSPEQSAAALQKFSAAEAGLVNARNAIDYVLAQVPEVDPNRLYASGHGSGGTLALLLAERDQRIKGCMLYAPVSDVVQYLANQPAQPAGRPAGYEEFAARFSPRGQESAIECPIFLFHAAGDELVPLQQSVGLEQRLRKLGKSVTFIRPAEGDHYQSMLSQGIPRAIAWLRSLGALPAASIAQRKAADQVGKSDTAGQGPVGPGEQTLRTSDSGVEVGADAASASSWKAKANSAFRNAQPTAGFQYLQAAALLNDKSSLWGRIGWNKTLSRPLLMIRWGVTLAMDDASAQLNAPLLVGEQSKTPLAAQSSEASQFLAVSGDAGQWLVETVQKYYDSGWFGPTVLAPAPRTPSLRGLVFLRTDERERMLAEARQQQLDVLALIDLKTAMRNRRQETTHSVRLVDVASGKDLWASRPIAHAQPVAAPASGSVRAKAADRPRGTDRGKVPERSKAVDLSKSFAGMNRYVEEHLKFEPPQPNAEVIQGRASELAARQIENPLGALFELRWYERQHLLSPEQTDRYVRQVAGEQAGELLASSKSADRLRALEKWLPAPRKPDP